MDALEERVTDVQEKVENNRRSRSITQKVAQLKTHEFISRTYPLIVFKVIVD